MMNLLVNKEKQLLEFSINVTSFYIPIKQKYFSVSANESENLEKHVFERKDIKLELDVWKDRLPTISLSMGGITVHTSISSGDARRLITKIFDLGMCK